MSFIYVGNRPLAASEPSPFTRQAVVNSFHALGFSSVTVLREIVPDFFSWVGGALIVCI